MKITNKYNLPEALIAAISNDKYDGGHGDISVTSLIAPVQQRRLGLKHWDALEEDASERIYALLGSSVHHVLQLAGEKLQEDGRDIITEKRFYHKIGGKNLSAQIDLYENRNLYDFKVTSVYAMKSAIEEGKDEWTAQLNIQAYLMEMNGHAVDELNITAIARDWNKHLAKRDPKMPPKACNIPITLWEFEATEKYILDRLEAHFGEETPECTPEECWERPTTYALMKKGRVSAVKVEATEQDLMNYAEAKSAVFLNEEADWEFTGGHYIEVRQGERVRCDDYCSSAPFCDQYKKWKQK